MLTGLSPGRAAPPVRGRCWWRAPAAPTRSPWPLRPRSWRPGSAYAAGLVTVDHGLQAGSRRSRRGRRRLGAHGGPRRRSRSATVDVAGRPGGPEAAAREARYEALVRGRPAARCRRGAARAHPRRPGRDRAARAGPRCRAARAGRDAARGRGLSAAAARREPGGHPQGVRRAGPGALGGPAQHRPAYARARVRADALPALVAALGPAVVATWPAPRSLLAADTAALDRWPPTALAAARMPAGSAVRRPGRPAGGRARPGCCTPGPGSWAPPAPRCRTGTWPRSTRWSPTGTGRGPPGCPAASGCPALGSPEPGGWPVRVLTELPSHQPCPAG